MNAYRSDEPPERIARPTAGRASRLIQQFLPLHAEIASADDPAWRLTLESWLAALPGLARTASPRTASKLADARAIDAELLAVLRGAEEGEGRSSERALFAVRALGRVQAIASMFACPGGTFIELISSSPWNLLGRGDPADPRTIHGAGTALVAHAVDWSVRRGCGGRVALQAGSAEALRFYHHLGFRRMGAADQPLALVPRGERGWSPEVLRVASGAEGAEEERKPWLVRDPVTLGPGGLAAA